MSSNLLRTLVLLIITINATAQLEYSISPINEHVLSVELSIGTDEQGQAWGLRKYVRLSDSVAIASSPYDSFYNKLSINNCHDDCKISYQIDTRYWRSSINDTESGYYSVPLNILLLNPLDDQNVELNIHLKGFSDTATAVSSLGNGRDRIYYKGSSTYLHNGMFVVGELHSEIINVNNALVTITTTNDSPRELAAVKRKVTDAIAHLRSYWNDQHPEHYNVFLLKNNNGSLKLGTHFKDFAFIKQLPDRADSVLLDSAIYHELNHQWISSKITGKMPSDHRMGWFYEGFNDYISSKIALDKDLLDKKIYYNLLNEKILTWQKLGIADVPISKLEAAVASKAAVQPRMFAGHAMARKLDAWLSSSPDRPSLQNLMLGLLEYFSNSNEQFFTEQMLHEYLYSAGYDDCSLKILELKEQSLNQLMNIEFNGVAIKTQKVDIEAHDFDFAYFIENSEVAALKAESTAAQCGLKDGDTITSTTRVDDNRIYRVYRDNRTFEFVVPIEYESREVYKFYVS